MKKTEEKRVWRLEGYDTFEGGHDAFYPIEGEYESESAAQTAARQRLKKLERSQPSSSSGGQSSTGIQDRVYIVRPNGEKYRFSG
ncbi:hypothetical protein A2841_01205 [Candidatus Kaiserbacteria bacterium RIFCSPHIGHO2_01_FULL_48_10]|uniref:Uncharacterized protein n=1 Tax=Candidatus Kaiserbacteria bacterium RIFCSPHIGHO2_01_FULL_48_10 TaxID=1798476 RepID=A0A1F6C4Y8_9BACT|nr:MAG: hypothetical protein A2841_01205 [Candidatus Kaiserbacteria bacterium RIFCSPHIGHO2_01_FULL_48_10]